MRGTRIRRRDTFLLGEASSVVVSTIKLFLEGLADAVTSVLQWNFTAIGIIILTVTVINRLVFVTG